MLMNSGNDAASAVANAAGGWEPSLRLMNEEAARLGAKDTVAATPNGLDRTEQLTSAADLAIIFREALKNPDITKIFRTKTLDAQTVNGRLIHLYNHNKMLQLNYPGHLGAKTGTTSMAGKTVVSAFKRGNRTLIVALMRYGSTMERASKPLYDWGFANAKKVEPVGQLPTVGPRPPVTPRPALQVDENGTPKSGQDELLAAVAPTANSSSGVNSSGAVTVLLLFAAAAGAVFGLMRWRARKPTT
jgi:D-alanyl-D-alanine carboxypeptidase (penicillin-binding protein 5/6)